MKRLIACTTFFVLCAFKEPENGHSAFISQYADIAIQMQKECGVPASVQLAQAIYESGGGKSEVAVCSNNLFGIRATRNWKGLVYKMGKGTDYRAYSTVYEGWENYIIFLSYHYPKAIGKDWKHWVKWCRGYGGGKDYWNKIGLIIQQNNLQKFDSR